MNWKRTASDPDDEPFSKKLAKEVDQLRHYIQLLHIMECGIQRGQRSHRRNRRDTKMVDCGFLCVGICSTAAQKIESTFTQIYHNRVWNEDGRPEWTYGDKTI